MNERNKIFRLAFFFLLIVLAGCSRREKITNHDLDSVLTIFHNERSPEVLVTSHRAMHTHYPENSLAAIQDAIDHGVDIVEIDVRTTRDGKMVLMHNSTIDATTGGTGKVASLTFKQLESYKLKAHKGDTAVYRVPLLEDALNLARGKIMVDLDMKKVFVKQLVAMVHKTHTGNQVLFFDSDFGVLDSVLLLDSTLLIMPRAHSPEDVTKIFERYHPPVVHIDDSFFTPEVVKQIKSHGARVWINALGVPDILAMAGITRGYRKLVEGGANILQTDRPVLLNNYLTRKGWR